MSDLKELLRRECAELRLKFEKASLEAKGTPSDISDRREAHVQSLLRKYFPAINVVTKGNILSTDGTRSSSIDCVLLNPAHPDLRDENQKHSLLLAEGVDAAIEVKPDLAVKKELERALIQGRKLKSIHRERTSIPRFSLRKRENAEALEKTLHTIPFCILTNKTPKDIKSFLTNIVEYYEEHSVKRIEQFDLIVDLNGVCIWNHCPYSYVNYRRDIRRAFIVVDLEDDALSRFIKWVDQVPKSHMPMSSSVLQQYLPTEVGLGVHYKELDRRLLSVDEKS